MESLIEFSQTEKSWAAEIRELYNAGKPEESVPMAVAFLKAYPDSLLARYSYAVQDGDRAYDPEHSELRKQELLSIAREGINYLMNHPDLEQCSASFQSSVKNEFFWFFERHREQYDHGIAEIPRNGRGGNYSACVGASMLALKSLQGQDIEDAESWAEKSLRHFYEFEKLAPDWYNINSFASQSMACLGKYQEARRIFLKMFSKQRRPVNPKLMVEFEDRISEIKAIRKDR